MKDNNRLENFNLEVSDLKCSEQLMCVWCGNEASKDILPKLCDDCFEKGCKAY